MSLKLGLSREYRPKTFSDTWGQDAIVQTLKNMVKSGRIDGYNAFLLVGTRGAGKTSTARNLARAVNCLRPIDGDPCNKCANCKMIISNATTDICEMDAASNRGVDDIASIITSSLYLPTALKRKVYIIDEVHQLSSTAKDALLKTLEDCPAHALFILATTEGKKVPPTIRSRCILFEFKNATNNQLCSFLASVLDKERISYDIRGLTKIAQLANGSYRDALSIVEGTIMLSGDVTIESVQQGQSLPSDKVIKDTVALVLDADTQGILDLLGVIIKTGGIDMDMYLMGVSDMLLVGARNALVSTKIVKGLTGCDLMDMGVDIRSTVSKLSGESPLLIGTMALLGAVDLANSRRGA